MGFILSVNTQNPKAKEKTEHSQKVQEPQKDILKMFLLYQTHSLMLCLHNHTQTKGCSF